MIKLAQMFNNAKKNEKGFTLVELMVVVVIIGILVAIAVPVYNNVSDRARTQAIEANVRILQGAVMMYHVSNNDVYPGAIDDLIPFVEGTAINGENGLGPSGVTYTLTGGTPPTIGYSGS